MGIKERIKDMLRTWLKITPENSIKHITIRDYNTLEINQIKNRMWYRGDATEIEQFFKAVDSGQFDSARFWASVPENDIRKAHSGLPSILVNTLAEMVKADLSDFEFDDADYEAKMLWEAIADENGFRELVGLCVADTLALGDGAFKISIDRDVSEYPILEYWAGDRTEYKSTHGRITEVAFKTTIINENGEYMLKEIYSKGAIQYRLFTSEGDEIPMDTLPEFADYRPVTFNGDFMLAVPVVFFKSQKYPNRGRSVYDNKTDAFDAHDEVISQWIDAMRAGRVTKYIPEDMIPRNPNDGAMVNTNAVNSFGTHFIKVNSSNKENSVDRIETVQPAISYDAFLQTYSQTLDMCLQGIVSPATLGIGVGRMASAEAQRERKDITGYTRNAITDALEKALPALVNIACKASALMDGKDVDNIDCTITFGEYGAPDFNDRIAIVSQASATGIMSLETMIDELWTNSKDDEWKSEELRRIMRDRGMIQADEPSANNPNNTELVRIDE